MDWTDKVRVVAIELQCSPNDRDAILGTKLIDIINEHKEMADTQIAAIKKDAQDALAGHDLLGLVAGLFGIIATCDGEPPESVQKISVDYDITIGGGNAKV